MDKLNTIGDYELLEIEIEMQDSVFFKGQSKFGKQVLIKTLKKEYPDKMEVSAAIHEFHLSEKIQEVILQPIEILKHHSVYYFVYEYFNGIPLAEVLKQTKKPMLDKLKIAHSLANALSVLHRHGVIHKNINSMQILLSEPSLAVKITGLTYATNLKQESYALSSQRIVFENHPLYMSPEQTGKMNKPIDHRSDLYSLGVVLYELFTGKFPFNMEDHTKLVHAHLAKTPINPSLQHADLPEMISEMILKLLEKTPDNRYKSAWGLREDLDYAINQYHAFGEIPMSAIGQYDNDLVFEIAGRLYGREKEITEIHNAFSIVANGGRNVVLIPGEAGIGKTALVNEIHKPLIKEKGYFISGKFEQMNRTVPLAPILAAFQSLIRQFLTENEGQVEVWKREIQEGLSVQSSILTALLPELAWLIGESKHANNRSLLDTQRLQLYSFQQFINIIATKDHPLVLFLDDLQWADIASLEWIEYMLTQANCQYFMIIAAYRENEIGQQHPFKKTLNLLEIKNVPISSIPIRNLSKKQVSLWLEQSFCDQGAHIAELSVHIYRITQGNPFYIRQLLKSFEDDGFITLLPEQRKWSIQEKYKESIADEDVLSFLIGRMELLPSNIQSILQLASCIGNRFDLKTLSIISGATLERTAELLWDTLEAGFILPAHVSYKWIYREEAEALVEEEPLYYTFLHDRIQQAFYEMMTEEEQEAAHLTIGRLLCMHESSIKNDIFTIVNHLNRTQNRLTLQEKQKLREWNITAAEKAKNAAAYSEALAYFEHARLLSEETFIDGQEDDLHYRLMKGLGECQYVTSQFSAAERTFDELLSYTKAKTEQLEIYNSKMLLYTHMHRVEESIQAGLEGLKLYGITFPEKLTKGDVAKEFLLVRLAFSKRKREQILTLPKLNNDEKLVLNTMITMNSAAYHTDQNLAAILMLRAVRYTLKHGIANISALVVNNYALILSSGFKDFQGSVMYGKLALELSEYFGDAGIKGRVHFVYGSFVNQWHSQISNNTLHLERSQRYCLDAGNMHLAGANSSFIVVSMLLQGAQLDSVLNTVNQQIQFINTIQYPISIGFLNELKHWTSLLQSEHPQFHWEMQPVLDDDSAKIMHYTIRLQMAYLFQKRDYAAAILQELCSLVNNRLTLVIVPEYYYYLALWCIKDAEIGRAYKGEWKKSLKKLQKWAKISPQNYKHKLLLIQAEKLKESEIIVNAKLLALYDESIRLAEENGFIQDAAIANESAGNYLSGIGHKKLAQPYFEAACSLFEQWGLGFKRKQLNIDYKREGAPIQLQPQQYYDVHDALQGAAQSISTEITMSKLASRLLGVAMEYAGADRGFILYKRKDAFFVGECKSLNEPEDELYRDEPITGKNLLAEKVVAYVKASNDPVVLHHAAADGLFIKDPYIMKSKTKSLFCNPFIRKGEVIGVLYLENRQATHVFTEEKTKLLSILTTQLSISIENVYVYETMEKAVAKKTEQLQYANQSLEKINMELEEVERKRKHFLANISHDLRTPVNVVGGYLEAIMSGLAKDEQEKEYLIAKAYERANELQELIQDLFELSQAESGRLQFDIDYIPLSQFIAYVQNRYENEQLGERMSFRIENRIANKDIEDYMIGVDPERIRQVFANLIGNAKKYTQSGEIVLSFKLQDHKELLITISDSGVGIPADILPFIFDRDYTNSYGDHKKKGHGLGLSICKEIITVHKGTIWAESQEGHGTSFYMTLPLFQFSLEN
ncbi:AAA family ATPase [Cytobacillus gottheilii]|uniref:AAA family ATPase n=1 Tax=Cytobacillus gottheilii TaxID=859144 RepID=UPI0009BA671F|nr:AAA family ATPase [Cytobacillus gottheilii]